jgi:predicted nucleic acid-binding protein
MMTSGRLVFVDTNILVYANLALSPWHTQAVQRLMALDAAHTPLWVSRQVLREYLAAMTRPGALTGTIPLPALLNDIRYFAQRFRVADEGVQVTTQLLALLAELPIAGLKVHDANIVATMRAYQIPRLLTHNTDDFIRFAAFVEVLPLVPPAAPGRSPST